MSNNGHVSDPLSALVRMRFGERSQTMSRKWPRTPRCHNDTDQSLHAPAHSMQGIRARPQLAYKTSVLTMVRFCM
jgi:hypothetical protein